MKSTPASSLVPAVSRRAFLQAFGLAALPLQAVSAADPVLEILDTHQHLWDTRKQQLPWLAGAPEILRRNYLSEDYAAATEGLPVRALYMEVDVAEAHLNEEAEALRRLCSSKSSQTFAAILGGRPSSSQFEDYLKKHSEGGFLKGLRRVLHTPETPRGLCLEKDFVRGIRALGQQGLTFDLCMRAAELNDAAALAAECPDTTLVLDHCGNADTKAFLKAPPSQPAHRAEDWQRAIDRVALKRNVHCKISGVIESMPGGWTSEQLSPVVNHCLDAFGPDRVVFGSNWPVCLLGGSLRSWVKALGEIVSARPPAERAKLWADNAKRIYRLG
jgi:predicted TIM-barrel fold metal-dependent hydrolase